MIVVMAANDIPMGRNALARLSNAIEADLWVRADRNMLETVVRNLTSNALKFTPRGGQVSLTASAGSMNGHPGFVTVSVRDTGVGMNEAVRANLFRLDSQHSTAGTENEGLKIEI